MNVLIYLCKYIDSYNALMMTILTLAEDVILQVVVCIKSYFLPLKFPSRPFFTFKLVTHLVEHGYKKVKVIGSIPMKCVLLIYSEFLT